MFIEYLDDQSFAFGVMNEKYDKYPNYKPTKVNNGISPSLNYNIITVISKDA